MSKISQIWKIEHTRNPNSRHPLFLSKTTQTSVIRHLLLLTGPSSVSLICRLFPSLKPLNINFTRSVIFDYDNKKGTHVSFSSDNFCPIDIRQCYLVQRMTKVPGKDIVACLNEAMGRQGLNMRVSALVNDTVATLAGARYWDNDVMVAVILGTGTNACYVESIDAIPKLKNHKSSSGKTIVNTEWGAFSNGLPLTEFDREMDAVSINPGEQLFEKTISGMYLGEIVRRVLVKMAEASSLFGNHIPERLRTPFTLGTPNISSMQQDTSDDLQAVGSILYEVTGMESTLDARKMVVEVCDTIAKRGGRLAGAGIVGILKKMEEDSTGIVFGKRTVVAMDGGLYEHHPQYKRYLKDAVKELLGPEISSNVVIEHSKDGSGIGAALLAATNSIYEH